MESETSDRRRRWLRDELVLALDLYVREGVGASANAVQDLSHLLRAYPVEQNLATDPRFRSTGAVKRKLANFLAIETSGQDGLTHAGRRDEQVWEEFAADPAGLSEAAKAIRRRITASE
jgi:hypothetical protein